MSKILKIQKRETQLCLQHSSLVSETKGGETVKQKEETTHTGGGAFSSRHSSCQCLLYSRLICGSEPADQNLQFILLSFTSQIVGSQPHLFLNRLEVI